MKSVNTSNGVSKITHFYIHESIQINIIKYFFPYKIIKISETNPMDEGTTIKVRDSEQFKNINNELIVSHTNEFDLSELTLMPVESNYQEIIDEDISMTSSDVASATSENSTENRISTPGLESPTIIEISESDDEIVCDCFQKS